MNCPRCQTPNPAEARFCLNCGLALTRKCSNCDTDLLPGARFCMHCGHPVIGTTPLDVSRLSRATAAAPETLAEKVRAATYLADERRIVTILLVDIVGSTALSEQLGVEIWTEVMNEVIDQVIPMIYRYEGTIARMLGDSFLAFFGAPVAHEDDPARSVRAAFDVMRIGQIYADQIKAKYDVDFALRACIHTGTVIINSVGEDLKYEYTALDGADILPSRIKFAATPMTIVMTDEAHRFVHPLFECEHIPPVAVKGRENPLQLYRLTGVKSEPGSVRGIRGLESPMVGRDAELNALLQLCETVRAGLGRAAVVIGEPGLGKSRLIAEWKAAVEGEQASSHPLWVEGRSLSYGQGLAYHLLIGVLRSIFDISYASEETETQTILTERLSDLFGDEMMAVYPYIGDLLSVDLSAEAQEMVTLPDPQTLQTEYFRAIRRLLLKLATQQPVVIVLEDLHWADSSSVDLFVKLLPVVTSGPMLLCLVTRDERDTPGWRLVNTAREMMGSSLTELSLRPLTDTDSRKMVANLLEIEALPEKVRKVILKKSEGNPFFVEEVIRMLIDRQAIVPENGGWVAGGGFDDIHIPDNLQGLLLARIDRLPEDVKLILRVASVIGRKFPVRVLEEVMQESIAWE